MMANQVLWKCFEEPRGITSLWVIPLILLTRLAGTVRRDE